jgi:hypothetical protein
VDNVDESSTGTGVTLSIANTAGFLLGASLRENRFQAALDSAWNFMPRTQTGAQYLGGIGFDAYSSEPVSGTWPLGWIRWNSDPVAGEPLAWRCDVAGTPGTWSRIWGPGLQAQADLGEPAPIADGTLWESADITVTGAAVGDYVLASFAGSHAGLIITGYVRATDQVRIVIFNKTGGPVDLSYQYFHVRVLKY